MPNPGVPKAGTGWRRLAATAFVVAVALGGAVAAASPAHAVDDIDAVSQGSPENSASVKSILVECPGDTKVYGTGATIQGGFGNVVIDDIIPLEDLSGVFVTAYENGAYAGNWRVIARAMCGSPVPGLHRAEPVTSGPDSFQNKSATAECPPFTRLIGSGGELTGAFGNVFLTAMVPDLPEDDVRVSASEDVPYSANWSVTAYAICVDEIDIRQGPDEETVSNSDSPKQRSVSCQLPGLPLLVHSMGFELLGAAGDVVLNNLSTVGGSELAATATAYENGESSFSWRVRTHAVCSI
jgi:hypothetical protein